MKITWTEGTPSEKGSFNHTAVWLNGRVYLGGGSENEYTSSYNINCYDPDRNLWNSINIGYRNFAMTTLDNKLVIAGGHAKESGKKTEKIQTLNAANQLKDYNSLKIARSHAMAAGYREILIVFGGKGEGNSTLSSTELLHGKTCQLYECRDRLEPRYSPKSVIVDNILYVLGGFDQHNYPSESVYTLPLDTVFIQELKWDIPSDQTPFYDSTPVSVNGTHLLIVGGYKKVQGNRTYTSNIHKPIDKKRIIHNREIIGHIPLARSNSAAVCTADNRIIVIGGENDKRQITNTVWIGSCEPQ